MTLSKEIMEENRCKVISLVDRLESWSDVYSSSNDEFFVQASNHGRLKFFTSEGNLTVLEFTEAVKFLSQTSKRLETALEKL